MASVNLEEKIQNPATCFTVFGDTHSGLLQGVDNNFNAVLADRESRELCFVRGETVMYIGFDKGDGNGNDDDHDRESSGIGGVKKRSRE